MSRELIQAGPQDVLPNDGRAVTAQVGVVVIGRNEGQRLRRCLASVVSQAPVVVYVDSGSTDDSVACARSLGVEVVDLDMSQPFTAARARNAGLNRLLELAPDTPFVQFVDGDCEIIDGWLEAGMAELEQQPDAVAAFGRLRECEPDRSIYNRLCELEWQRSTGDVDSCGGIALMRVAALRAVDGFNPSVVAGEEPELCVRLRRAGGRIVSIAQDMAWHDAAMTGFGQWWRRSVRSGHAYAQGAWLHGRGDGHGLRQVTSILFWALLMPILVLAAAILLHPLFLLLIPAGYTVLWWRVQRHGQRQPGRSPADARLVATFTLIAKFAQLAGVLRFAGCALFGRQPQLIEYKQGITKSPTATESA